MLGAKGEREISPPLLNGSDVGLQEIAGYDHRSRLPWFKAAKEQFQRSGILMLDAS